MKKKVKTPQSQNSGPAQGAAAMGSHPVLGQTLGYCLAKAAMRSRQMMDLALQPYQILTYQFAILKLLKFSGPLSQIEIGNTMGIDKASMVRFLDGLEQRNFIIRSADKTDRRIKNIAITAEGIKMFKQAEKLRNQVQEEFLSPLTKAERLAYSKIMPKLAK